MFPGANAGTVLNAATLRHMLKAMGHGGEVTTHGMRATFKTWAERDHRLREGRDRSRAGACEERARPGLSSRIVSGQAPPADGSVGRISRRRGYGLGSAATGMKMKRAAAPLQLTITIAPDRTLFVSLCDANGTQSSPRMLPGDLDWRLGAFVAAMQAIAEAAARGARKPRPSGARETATQRSPSTQHTANTGDRRVIMLQRMQHRRVTQIVGDGISPLSLNSLIRFSQRDDVGYRSADLRFDRARHDGGLCHSARFNAPSWTR